MTNNGSAIDFVFWDFGGVFVLSPFHASEDYAANFGMTSAQLLERIFGRYDLDEDHVWHRLERGEVGMVDAIAEIEQTWRDDGYDNFSMREFFTSMAGHSGQSEVDRSMVVNKVRSLRSAGVPSAIITNNIAEFGDTWRGMIPVDELFEFVVDSSSEGVRKPDPEIYRRALARAGDPDPARTVFLDDFEPNVVAARNQGMHGIVVGADPTEALAQLDALVGDSA